MFKTVGNRAIYALPLYKLIQLSETTHFTTFRNYLPGTITTTFFQKLLTRTITTTFFQKPLLFINYYNIQKSFYYSSFEKVNVFWQLLLKRKQPSRSHITINYNNSRSRKLFDSFRNSLFHNFSWRSNVWSWHVNKLPAAFVAWLATVTLSGCGGMIQSDGVYFMSDYASQTKHESRPIVDQW